jgi:hypothetical protein
MRTQNPLVKILIILDRRIGKRTLLNMKESIENEEAIVKYFYKLRCEAREGKEFFICQQPVGR